MLTSTPIKPCLERSRIRIEEILPDLNDTSNSSCNSSTRMISTRLRTNDQTNNYWKRNITRSSSQEGASTIGDNNNTSLEMKIDKHYNKIIINPLQIETNSFYNSVDDDDSKLYRKIREFGTNTESPLKRLERARFLVEDIAPVIINKIDKRSYGTVTNITMKDVLTNEDVTVIVDDALRIYKNTVLKKTSNRGTQCAEEIKRIVDKRDQRVQTNELSSLIKFKSNVGVTAKPRCTDVGLEVRINPDTRTIAVGPDPLSIRNISLNSINSRSHSFNYGDNIDKRKTRTMKSVGVMVDDLIKMATKSLDTDDLIPKRREFGTSPIKKKFIDVSVGDSIKPHILISCSTNYCDNCKETIKMLAKQITNNNVENNMNHQNANLVSRIPRPSHIALNTSDHKKFKRQDTYTKIPATGIIRYDSDNKEQYDSSNR